MSRGSLIDAHRPFPAGPSSLFAGLWRERRLIGQDEPDIWGYGICRGCCRGLLPRRNALAQRLKHNHG